MTAEKSSRVGNTGGFVAVIRIQAFLRGCELEVVVYPACKGVGYFVGGPDNLIMRVADRRSWSARPSLSNNIQKNPTPAGKKDTNAHKNLTADCFQVILSVVSLVNLSFHVLRPRVCPP